VLWHIRPGRIVLATGAIERPMVFPDNDRPGIMSAEAALAYLRRHHVLVGKRIVVATNNDSAYETARALAAAGAEVTIGDTRQHNSAMDSLAMEVLAGIRVDGIEGLTPPKPRPARASSSRPSLCGSWPHSNRHVPWRW
jgi:sarcosine oxidase, subunit alpha